MQIITDIVGYAAATVGTILMLPQVYKSYRTRRVDDISMVMVIVYIVNCTLWEIYGWMLDSMPIILCNLIALVIAFVQLYLKIWLGSKKKL
ncbi:MAG: SemiSWEET family transporter [Bacteroidales bacterium]|nr:SemiSWEET family transporter [Bacteroidales bacterium]